MEYSIRAYVDELFRDVPDSQRAYEMKVELTQNLLDKYNDLIASGKSEEDAYNITIYGIGDITELLEQMRREEQVYPAVSGATYYEALSFFRRRKAGLVAVGVMLYIFSLIPLVTLSILSGVYDNAALVGVGLGGFFLCIGAATGLLVWNGSTTPKKSDPPEIVIDLYMRRTNSGHPVLQVISGSFWLLVTAAYFLLSFLSGRWDITWIIFIVAPAVYGFIRKAAEKK